MKFIHTADWHLGKVLNQERLTGQQKKVIDDLLRLAAAEDVDAVVIAGDIYDRSVPPEEAVELFDYFVRELVKKQGRKLLYIAGNHDSAERIQFGADILAAGGVYVRGVLTQDLSPITLYDEFGAVYFSLLPFFTPEQARMVFGQTEENDADLSSFAAATDFVAKKAYAAIAEAARRDGEKNIRSVAVAHAFVTGGKVSDSERTISVGTSGEVKGESFAPFSYTAIGHLHFPQTIADNLRYSGSLLKYSLSEYAQKKSFSLVTIDAAGKISVAEKAITPERDLRLISGKSFAEILDEAKTVAAPAKDDYLWLKPTDREPVFAAMEKIRPYYPHTLRIIWDNAQRQTGELAADGARRASQPLNKIFADFYQQVTGEALTETERDVLEMAIESLKGGEAL